MKKVFFTLLLSMLLVGYNEANDVPVAPDDGIVVTITIEIGVPIVCLPEWSICRFKLGGGSLTGTTELVKFPDSKSSGGGSGGGGGGSWFVHIPKDAFAELYPQYLPMLEGKSTVTFVSSTSAGSDVKKALGTTLDLVVQGGVPYPLTLANGVYTIEIPVK